MAGRTEEIYWFVGFDKEQVPEKRGPLWKESM